MPSDSSPPSDDPYGTRRMSICLPRPSVLDTTHLTTVVRLSSGSPSVLASTLSIQLTPLLQHPTGASSRLPDHPPLVLHSALPPQRCVILCLAPDRALLTKNPHPSTSPLTTLTPSRSPRRSTCPTWSDQSSPTLSRSSPSLALLTALPHRGLPVQKGLATLTPLFPSALLVPSCPAPATPPRSSRAPAMPRCTAPPPVLSNPDPQRFPSSPAPPPLTLTPLRMTAALFPPKLPAPAMAHPTP